MTRSLSVLVALVLSFAAACSSSDDDVGITTTEKGASTTWFDVDQLYHRDRIEPDPGTFGAQVSYPDQADLAYEVCGPDCSSQRHSMVVCPGISYPKVDGIEKVGGFLRRTNGSETGDEIGLHIGFFFYTCDDFCGRRPGTCAPGVNTEYEYGVKINVATNKFNFYQSYDSNACGARNRVDSLNGNFDPTLRHGTFRILVNPDGSYRVKELDEKGNLIATQEISNCTMEHDCRVLCGGGQPACDGNCSANCEAKHKDEVNLFQVGGKVDVHTMKKQGAKYAYWSEPSSAGLPSTNLADAVRVHASGNANGTCSLADASGEPAGWDAEDLPGSSSMPTCTPATCATLGQICGTWPDGCGGTVDCGACAPTSCGATCDAFAQDACSCDSECCEGQCNTHGKCCIDAGLQGCSADADCCNSGTYGGPNVCGSGGKCCKPIGTQCTSSAECCANHVCSAGKCQ